MTPGKQTNNNNNNNNKRKKENDPQREDRRKFTSSTKNLNINLKEDCSPVQGECTRIHVPKTGKGSWIWRRLLHLWPSTGLRVNSYMIPPRIFLLQQDSLCLPCPIPVAINPEWLFKFTKIKYNERFNSSVTPAPFLRGVLLRARRPRVARAAVLDAAITVEGSMDSTVLDGFPAFDTQQCFEIFGNYVKGRVHC